MSLYPKTPNPEPGIEHHHFINRALSFTLLENIFKPISPILELVCAGLFAGGIWGRYKFYESLVFLLFRISLMGIDKGIIWYFSQVEEKVYRKTFFRGLCWSFGACAVLGLFTWASYAGWLPFSDWVIGRNAESFHIPGGEFLLYLCAVPMMVLAELCIQANVNKQNLKYRILVPGILVPLITYGAAIFGNYFEPTLFTLPRCFLAGWSVGAVVAFWGFARVHRISLDDISFGAPPLKLIRFSLPLASANIFSALAVRADIFMLAGFTNVRSVEIYSVVIIIGKSLTSIRQSFENILLSAFSSSKTGQLTFKIRQYFNYANWMVMSIQGVLLSLVIVFGAEVLGLINSQYSAGYWTLVVTAMFIYINTVFDFTSLLALGLGRTIVVPLVQILFFAINVGLNLVLIPKWDTAGAALSLGLANLSAGIIYFAYLAWRHKSWLLLREYWLPTLAEVLVLGIPVAALIHWESSLGVKAIGLVFVVGVVFWMQRHWYRRFNPKQVKLKD